jgi:hypothetical protein
MVYESLEILKEQLAAYFNEINLNRAVILQNIALWEQGGSETASNTSNKLILTLLRIEEEPTLKNSPSYRVRTSGVEYQNPPIHLNLYILIAANFDNYEASLISLSKTIEFFQGRKVFTSSDTIYNRDNVSLDIPGDFKLILELYSPTFEELNNIWGTFGGRQLPSVIYKLQLVTIDRDKKLAEAGLITRIGGTLNDI